MTSKIKKHISLNIAKGKLLNGESCDVAKIAANLAVPNIKNSALRILLTKLDSKRWAPPTAPNNDFSAKSKIKKKEKFLRYSTSSGRLARTPSFNRRSSRHSMSAVSKAHRSNASVRTKPLFLSKLRVEIPPVRSTHRERVLNPVPKDVDMASIIKNELMPLDMLTRSRLSVKKLPPADQKGQKTSQVSPKRYTSASGLVERGGTLGSGRASIVKLTKDVEDFTTTFKDRYSGKEDARRVKKSASNKLSAAKTTASSSLVGGEAKQGKTQEKQREKRQKRLASGKPVRLIGFSSVTPKSYPVVGGDLISMHGLSNRSKVNDDFTKFFIERYGGKTPVNKHTKPLDRPRRGRTPESVATPSQSPPKVTPQINPSAAAIVSAIPAPTAHSLNSPYPVLSVNNMQDAHNLYQDSYASRHMKMREAHHMPMDRQIKYPLTATAKYTSNKQNVFESSAPSQHMKMQQSYHLPWDCQTKDAVAISKEEAKYATNQQKEFQSSYHSQHIKMGQSTHLSLESQTKDPLAVVKKQAKYSNNADNQSGVSSHLPLESQKKNPIAADKEQTKFADNKQKEYPNANTKYFLLPEEWRPTKIEETKEEPPLVSLTNKLEKIMEQSRKNENNRMPADLVNVPKRDNIEQTSKSVNDLNLASAYLENTEKRYGARADVQKNISTAEKLDEPTTTTDAKNQFESMLATGRMDSATILPGKEVKVTSAKTSATVFLAGHGGKVASSKYTEQKIDVPTKEDKSGVLQTKTVLSASGAVQAETKVEVPATEKNAEVSAQDRDGVSDKRQKSPVPTATSVVAASTSNVEPNKSRYSHIIFMKKQTF